MANLQEWNAAKQEGVNSALTSVQRNPGDREAALAALSAAVVFDDEPALHQTAAIIDQHLSGDAEVQMALGHALLHVHRAESAADAFRGALLAQDSPETREALAWALLQAQQPREALPWLEHLLRERHEASRLGLLYATVGGFQSQGQHQDASRLLDEIAAAYPQVANTRDHGRLVKAARLGRTTRLPNMRVLSDPAAASRRGKRTLIGASALLAVVPGGYLLVAVMLGRSREVLVVNGTDVPYQVVIDGQTMTLAAQSRTVLRLGEGHVAVETPGLPLVPAKQMASISTPLLIRPFLKRTFVINPDRTALILWEQTEYGPGATGASDDYRIQAGDLTYMFSDIDYPFRGFPQTIQMKGRRGVEVRRRIDHLADPDHHERFNLVEREIGPERALEVARQAALFDPANGRAAQVLADRMSDDELLVFLEPIREQRPILVAWHRLYQEAMERAHRKDEMRADYAALLAEQPDDPARRYLAARLLDDHVERERVFREVIDHGPAFEPACHWLAYAMMSTGRFEEALEMSRRLLAIDPESLHYHQHEIEVLLALGRLEEALDRNSERWQRNQLEGWLTVERMVLLMRLGRESVAEEIASTFLTRTRDASSPEVADLWLEWIDAVRAYQRGDERGYGERMAKVEDAPYRRIEGLLSLGRAGEALQVCRDHRQEIGLEHWMYVSIAARDAGDLTTADAALADLVTETRSSREDERMVADWLAGPLPGPDLVLQYRTRTAAKLALLVVMGQREVNHEHRRRYFDLARRLNCDTTFPFLLMKRAMDAE